MADEPVLENARPVCHRPLPPVRPGDASLGSILLFYQYVEPVWTKSGAFGRFARRGRVLLPAVIRN